MGKPLSWKWKLTLVFLVFVLFVIAFLSSSWGNDMLAGWARDAYTAMPESERRDSVWAKRYLFATWWRARILGDNRVALKMYQEFFGILPDKDGNDFVKTHKLNGLVSEDGSTGWGPFHPDALDYFMDYLDICETEKSKQRANEDYLIYYKLFYEWARDYSKEHKPHPLFKKYWEKIQLHWVANHYSIPPGVDRKAADAPECEKANPNE